MTPDKALKEIFSRPKLPPGVERVHRYRWKLNRLSWTAKIKILEKSGYEVEIFCKLKNQQS